MEEKKNISPLISVIVPVYNVQKYLDECIQSIMSQSYDNLEIILIDDGSTDGSGKKCDDWQSKDSRIKVIHQSNSGVSSTRNVGINTASGLYLCFIDSDDYVSCDFVKALYQSIEKFGTDVACCEMSTDDNNLEWNTTEKVEIISGINACRRYIKAEAGVSPYVWNKLYKREVLIRDDELILFPAGKIHEDHFFTPRILFNASSVSLLKSKLYFYRQNEFSIMHKKFDLKRFDVIDNMEENICYFTEYNAPSDIVDGLKMRKAVQQYLCIAKAHRIKLSIPSKYRMSEIKAYRKMRRLLNDDEYTLYYVSTVRPLVSKALSYLYKIF